MENLTPDLCDEYPDLVEVVEPLFSSFGGRIAFGGKIATVKCFEDNSLVKEALAEPGEGKVLVVDGGASMRRALMGDMIAQNAVDNGWAGVVIYGCIRDIDIIMSMDLGVQAINTVPMKTDKRGEGQRDIAVTFGGVTFKPGAYVYADNNGVIVSPEALSLPE